MSKLPNRSGVRIDPRKITHYLLDPHHRVGGPKSIFFFSHGFRLDNARQLEDALRQHAYDCEVMKIKDNGFGVIYTLEGALQTPDGRTPIVRSVWFMASAQADLPPSFVTAFPGPKENKS
jgi:hypothetical protein